MYRTREIMFIVTMIAVCYCCCFITTYPSFSEKEQTSEKKQTEIVMPKIETPSVPKPEIETPSISKSKIKVPGTPLEKQEEKENGEQGNDDSNFDLSFPGDNKVQSIDLFFERRFLISAFKFRSIESKGIEFKLEGNYFLTFEKPELPEKESMWKTLLASFSGWKLLSNSYAFRLEGSTVDKLGAGGYIEIEGDHSIETDPHLHTTLYAEWVPVKYIEFAIGGWAEVQQLWGVHEDLENLPDGYSRDQYGLRAHIDIKGEGAWVAAAVMFEYLPHVPFDNYRFSISPEVEFKLRNKKILFIDEFPFSIVIKGEFDYDTANEYSTLEPLVEINPWEVRWTQLVRHTF